MNGFLRVLVWLIYGAAILFVWAYVAMWGIFAFGTAWAVGVLVAVALTVGGFFLVRNIV